MAIVQDVFARTEQITGMFAGVDWGGSFHQLCVLNASGTLVVQQRIDHDVAGLALLAARLAGWPVWGCR